MYPINKQHMFAIQQSNMKIKHLFITVVLVSLLTASVGLNIFHLSHFGGGMSLFSGILGKQNHSRGNENGIFGEQSDRSLDIAHANNGSIEDSDGGYAPNGNAGNFKTNKAKQGSFATISARSAGDKRSGGKMLSTGIIGWNMAAADRAAGSTATDRKEQIRSHYENHFESFFSKNSLDEEKKKLIIDTFTKQQESFDKYTKSNPYVDKNREAFMKEWMGQFRETLEGPLGDKDFESLWYYHLSTASREVVGTISDQMSAAGCDLSDANTEALVGILYDNHIIPYSVLTPGDEKPVAIYMAQNKELAMTKAGKFLSQQQMTVLQQYWNNYINSNLTEEERNDPNEALKQWLSKPPDKKN